MALRFTINSIVALERELKMPISRIAAEFSATDTASMDLMRTVYWAGMLADNPVVTLEQAGDAMSAIGAAKAGAEIGAALQEQFPTENPQQPPAAKTGTAG
jgi:hypothetical protein